MTYFHLRTQLASYANVRVSKFEAAAVALHSPTPEKACSKFLDLIHLAPDATGVVGTTTEGKVELLPEAMFAVLGKSGTTPFDTY
jgi:hypothetical protein